MKQTAIEWLVTRIAHGGLVGKKQFDELVKQAKEMEKEQAIEFGKIIADKWGMVPVPLENIEETYNETFKSE